MSATIKPGSDRTVCNQDKQQAPLIYDSNGGVLRYVKSDPIHSGTQVVTTVEHYEIHAANMFWVNYNATLANADLMQLAFTTANVADRAHMTVHISGTSSGTFYLYESVTSYTGGAAATHYNRFRGGAADIHSSEVGRTGVDAIARTGGTAIYTELVGATRGVDWDRRSGQEIILLANKIYIFAIQNGANANTVTILLDWYNDS